jgi:hypothetical protein
VTGLTGGDTYTFTVTATNAVGTGPASSQSNAVTLAVTFYYTGSQQTFTVPSGVYSLNITVNGASGGNTILSTGSIAAYGGYGATVSGTMSVTPGEQFTIVVGGMGGEGGLDSYGYYGTGGYSVGYVGGAGSEDGYGYYGGGGGGGSVISGPTETIVAGGGGGAGIYADPYPTYYGAYGGQSGSSGNPGGYGGQGSGFGNGGGGASTSSGGSVGGAYETGGSGAGSGLPGGGGGGGYYGGGGSEYGGGGGGGSSFVPSGASVTGNNIGNGSVSITF